MKKGFTLAEALVTMIVIGVIMALAIPAVKESTKDSPLLFKKAYNTVETVVSELLNDLSKYPSGEFANNTFCSNFFDKLNAIGTVDCSTTSVLPADRDDPGTFNASLTNSMHWYFVEKDGFSSAVCPSGISGNCIAIQVDVNGPYKGANVATDAAENQDIFTIIVSDSGKVTVSGTNEVKILKGEDY